MCMVNSCHAEHTAISPLIVFSLSIFSDTLISNLDHIEPVKFDAARLGNVSPEMFTDLLMLTGLPDEKDISTSRSSSHISTMVQETGTEQSPECSLALDEDMYEKNELKDANEVVQKRCASDTDLLHNTDDKRTASMPELSLYASKSIVGSKTSLTSSYSDRSVSSCVGSLHGLIESIVSLGALKALVVIIKSNKFLNNLMSFQTIEVLSKSSSYKDASVKPSCSKEEDDSGSLLSKEMPNIECLDEGMMVVLQSVMACMVKCSILPSPIKQIVGVGELERAQTVLLNQVITAAEKAEETDDEKKCKYHSWGAADKDFLRSN